MTARPTATVVVVTFNNAAEIELCIGSLTQHTKDTDIVVVIVDNASTDDTVALARGLASRDRRIRVLANEHNAGFGAACNQGARAGDGTFVVLLNPDTVTHLGAIDALTQVAARQGIGPVGGKTVDAGGQLDGLSAQNAPDILGILSWAIGSPAWGRRLPGPIGRLLGRNPGLLALGDFEAERPVGVVIGCLLALRRTDWEALGGFDETFFMYGEDVDLSLRARASGLTPTYTPDAVITHFVGRSSATRAAKIVMVQAGRLTVIYRHWSPRRAAAGRALILLGTAARALGERLRGAPGPWSEAFARRGEWLSGYPGATAVRAPASER